jgi:molybdopterin-binding protein
MSAPLLRASVLVRRYGSQRVVDGVSLDVAPHEVLAILGPNGAGKSTLFRMLLLLEPADAGEITFDGRAVRCGDAAARRRMAGVFQRPWLFRGTVRHNLEFGVAKAARTRVADSDVVSALALGALLDAPVTTLSGGEAQRVALARALVLEPDLLLLDEPSANLDVTVQRRFRADLEHLVRSHARAAVLVTHDPAEAFALADRVAVLEDGRVTQTGTPAELVAAPATPFVAAFTGAELLLDGAAADAADGLMHVKLPDGVLLLATLGTDVAAIAAGSAVHVAYRPEDVTLAHDRTAVATSAVNRLPMTVRALTPSGGLVRVRLDGPPMLTALVTRQSVDALGLMPGQPVTAHLKAAALRVYPA